MGSVRRRVTSKLGQLRERVEVARSTNERNIVLTGPGRSGTTLTCHLLNKLPNTVALAEPLPPNRFEKQRPDYDAVCDELEKVYLRMRRKALKQGLVRSKHVGGIVPDNTKGQVDGVRQRIAVKGDIPVGKDLDKDFYLAIKQPGMFTALLPGLAKRFPCYAIVRNPLAIIASTGSIQSRKKGKNPSAKMRYDSEYRRQVEEDKNAGAEQMAQRLKRMNYNFERYEQSLPRQNIIRYEDICATGGKALQVITPAAANLDEPLENKNANPLYDRERILRVGEALLESEGAYWNFYEKRDVEEILDNFR
ncbi:MAG: hypothetical protein AVDCRST_MAG02-4713 [uncultured Rubrobacteraceae bacterium]|uniref:Sulfotransferase domain-containing protein n=1 Tax=uncultured Rubrobacteraceae bacterium TaxID=349277 RepID=A0A6J4RPJ8_9ACTN|nr:MAG: hypothetical protein AVDCRST_MAG02-4713 [uncultured Rubrobacteraceae bacterium]